jgi:hypothetical protein
VAIDTPGKRFSAVNVGSPWRGLAYFPTGTVDASERLAVAFLYSGIAATAPVQVPDVVGETQAQATTDLQSPGFVVSVTTAYSSSVAAGLVISQSPTAGSFAAFGSTVTIVVSLGDAPVPPPVDTGAAGGWPIFSLRYEMELARRRKRERERRELEEESERIDEPVSREIASLLREQERKDDKRAELDRLRVLAEGFAAQEARAQYGERVSAALERALRQGNFSALEALDREIGRARRDEEDFLMLAVTMILGSE